VTTTTPSGEVTELLAEFEAADQACAAVLPLVYDELRMLADRALRGERSDHTLQPTALVHEAYLRLLKQDGIRWRNRAHFLGVAACLMRRILVDHARAHATDKRGGGHGILPLDEVLAYAPEPPVDIVALDEALTRLAELDRQQSRVVELRFFGGLTIEETAETLAISPATVKREWTLAKAWLYREVSEGATAHV